MCGIVAVISSKAQTSVQNNVFKDMLVMDQLRGKDSVGMFGVSKQGVDTFKSIAHPSDFLQLKKAVSLIGTSSVLVGHNRHATLGAVNSNNAHPFQHGAITLVHNGTLGRFHALPDQSLFDTDSECVAWNLAKQDTLEDIKKFLASLSGAFAFVWYDEDVNATYFIRNDERPLSMAQLEGSLYLSSERGILIAALDRRGVKFKLADIVSVPVDTLFTVSTDTKGELTISSEEVVLKKKFVQQDWYRDYQKNTTTHYPAVTRNALELELGILAGTWHSAVVTEVVTYSARNFGNVTCRMTDKDYECTVLAYNVDLSAGYKLGDLIEVQLQSLDMNLHGNAAARENKDLTLRGSLVRKVEDTPHICECCGGIFTASEGFLLAQGGEFVCKPCYDSDEATKLYVDTNKV